MTGTASGVIFTKRVSNHDMILFKGKTVGFSLTWGGATPEDVTGFSAELIVKNLDGSTYAAAGFNTGNSRVAIGTTNGLISFSMTSTDSAALTAGQYTYEINVTDTDSTKMLVMSGKCEIR